MTCEGYVKETGECKYGFPVTTGCWASGILAKNMAHTVYCINEEWCGKTYNESGGKPPRLRVGGRRGGGQMGHMSKELIKKMMQALEDDELAIIHEGNTYLLFDEIKIETGGKTVTFKKDGFPVTSVKTENIQEAIQILISHDMLEEAEKLERIAEECECVDCKDPSCSGCQGLSVHHTCGKEPKAQDE